jgi:16S rRNA (guanine527-N7)-methyltransferase
VNSASINLLEKFLREKGRLDRSPFSESEIRRFLLYFELVLKWNPRLHLTTLVDPQQFFQFHIFESDFAASLLLPNVTRFWDLGTGLGIPGIPIAIFKPDLSIHLVEAKRHKGIFLEEVIDSLGLSNVEILNQKIEFLESFSSGDCAAARAVEQMEELIPTIIELGAESSQIFLFGSVSLESKIKPFLLKDFQVQIHRIPDSDRRNVFNIVRST